MRQLYEDIWAALGDELDVPDREARERMLAALPLAPGQAVLDLGCGAGHFTRLLCARGAEVTAADIAEGALERTRRTAPGATAVRIEPHGPWPFPSDTFDAVWCSETIEHVADTTRWLDELHRVAKPGGALTITTPHHGRLRCGFKLLLRGPETILDPRSDHLRFYSPASLETVLADAGFTDIASRRVGGLLIAAATA